MFVLSKDIAKQLNIEYKISIEYLTKHNAFKNNKKHYFTNSIDSKNFINLINIIILENK